MHTHALMHLFLHYGGGGVYKKCVEIEILVVVYIYSASDLVLSAEAKE